MGPKSIPHDIRYVLQEDCVTVTRTAGSAPLAEVCRLLITILVYDMLQTNVD